MESGRNLCRIDLKRGVVVLNSNIGIPKTRNLCPRSTRWVLAGDESNLLLYQDSLWGEEDGVFRIALPNGTYEITCYFYAGIIAPVDINLIANGEKKFQKLRLTSANESAERRYTVTITNERLTQVIYTQKKHWVWNGFTVKQLSN